MIELFTWNTDNGHKARQAMEESGLPFQLKPINLQKKEQFAPDFLKISPGHKIPALIDNEGPGGKRVTMCESGTILKYLAEKAGGALYPSEPVQRIMVDQWFFYGTSTFTPLAQQYGLFTHRFGSDVPPAQKHYGEVLRDLFSVLNTRLGEAEYLGGKYSIADISCYPDVHIHGKRGIGLKEYPNLERWHDAIAARPAVQRAWVPIPV
jgi:GSH-dependent disulfide-bond oxidoreductase